MHANAIQTLPDKDAFADPEADFHTCIRDNDFERFRQLLETDSAGHVDYLDNCWGAPLHVAMLFDRMGFIDLLLSAGADATTQRQYMGAGNQPPSPMSDAVARGNLPCVQKMWQSRRPEEYANCRPGQYHWTGIAYAAHCRQVRILGWLLDAWDGWSQAAKDCALAEAAGMLDFPCIAVLTDKCAFSGDALNTALCKATVETEHEIGLVLASLHTAADTAYQKQIVERLIERGANPNSITTRGEPLVIEAAEIIARGGALQALLEGGADPDSMSRDGLTAVQLLASPIPIKRSMSRQYLYHDYGVQLFLKHGASVQKTDASGNTPAHIVAFSGTASHFHLYFDKAGPPGAENASALANTNNHGESFLHSAAAGGNIEVIRYILQLRGIDNYTNASNRNGWTPLMCALAPTRKKSLAQAVEAATMLLDAGADAGACTEENWTPLHCLALYRDSDTGGAAQEPGPAAGQARSFARSPGGGADGRALRMGTWLEGGGAEGPGGSDGYKRRQGAAVDGRDAAFMRR